MLKSYVPIIDKKKKRSAVNPINSADPYTSKFFKDTEERMNINGQRRNVYNARHAIYGNRIESLTRAKRQMADIRMYEARNSSSLSSIM